MKQLFLGLLLVFPIFCGAANNLEFELIRTEETPGFFAVTIFPAKDSQPISRPVIFVKNFTKKESPIYTPIIDFLTELGANIVGPTVKTEKDTQIITLGTSLPLLEDKNFSSHNAKISLEQFEVFSLQNLKPVFLKNLHVEFGGNISDVEQYKKDAIDEQGITFVGKFKEDMRTRMAIIGDDEIQSLQFETPLNLPDKNLSQSPLAKELPQIWEQLQKKRILPTQPFTSFFPWILGLLGLIIFVVLFIRHTYKHNKVFEEQNSIQEELPWQTISAQEERQKNPPFDLS